MANATSRGIDIRPLVGDKTPANLVTMLQNCAPTAKTALALHPACRVIRDFEDDKMLAHVRTTLQNGALKVASHYAPRVIIGSWWIVSGKLPAECMVTLQACVLTATDQLIVLTGLYLVLEGLEVHKMPGNFMTML